MHSEHRHALPARGILTLRAPHALQLRVMSGCVWLTESQDPQDHFLQPGDSFRLRSDRAVIEAQQDSLITLLPAASEPSAWGSWCSATVQMQALEGPWWQQRDRLPLASWFQRPFKG